MNAPKTPFAPPHPEDYGTEVLCANWNPVVAAVVEPIGQACREWLADLSGVDVDTFLQQFYRCQR
ncbi:MAG: hypothetical protein A3G24_10405 [Betaproteobacteria bacterium RIFCSPLOWO2_12_FULL_62_13]|nr:MAG: hypothetical protein A3G24_10405 [Betaproteobacteria bacterium RIFCSPLOWO2_12_FULL_62_13]